MIFYFISCEVGLRTQPSSIQITLTLSHITTRDQCTRVRVHMTSRCQSLFPPRPFFKGKALGMSLAYTETNKLLICCTPFYFLFYVALRNLT